jgi:hypothetical protein
MPGTAESQLLAKGVVLGAANTFAEGEGGRSERARRQPLAAALGQKGLLAKLLRRKVLRKARLAAGNGSQIAVIMPQPPSLPEPMVDAKSEVLSPKRYVHYATSTVLGGCGTFPPA